MWIEGRVLIKHPGEGRGSCSGAADKKILSLFNLIDAFVRKMLWWIKRRFDDCVFLFGTDFQFQCVIQSH